VALEFVAFLDFLESGKTYSDTLFISTQVLIIVMNEKFLLECFLVFEALNLIEMLIIIRQI